MRKASNFLGTLLGLMLLALLALTLAALFQGQQAIAPVAEPVATATPVPPENTPIPAVIPTAAIPTMTPVPTQLLLPACQFNGTAIPEETGPELEAYVFSEPQVVLTHSSAIAIVEWLPDGQRLLIGRRVPNSLKERIDTYDVQTGKIQPYGEWQGFSTVFDPKPVWLNSLQAVALVDESDKPWALRITRGENAPVEKPVRGLSSRYLDASPDGQQVVLLPDTPDDRPQVLETTQPRLRTLPFALPLKSGQAVALGEHGQTTRSNPYQMIWQPSGNHIAFFNNTGFYLADTDSKTICEIDLGTQGEFNKHWALVARWSYDGRYLALLTTVGEPIVPFIDLTLIDTSTGQLRRLNLGNQDLHAIAWAPNRHDLLVIAAPPRHQPEQAHLNKVYLVDATTGNSRQILTEYQSEFTFHSSYGAAWSPDGQAVALSCPVIEHSTIVEGRLCIIPVEVKPGFHPQ